MRYVPERGDIVWINLNPQAGHEQGGHRPALVLSPKAYNAKVGLMLCCPITSQAKGYPFEVDIRGGPHVSGVVLADQVGTTGLGLRIGVAPSGNRHSMEPVARRVPLLRVGAAPHVPGRCSRRAAG